MWEAIAGGVAYLLVMWLWAWSFARFWNLRTRLNTVENHLKIHEHTTEDSPSEDSNQSTLDEF